MAKENKSQEKSTMDFSKMSLKNITKGTIWDCQENDVLAMLAKSEKEVDFEDSYPHYLSIIRSAFSVEFFDTKSTSTQMKLEKQGHKLINIKYDNKTIGLAIKKKVIKKITDFTYENIHHVSAAQVLEVLSNNFGGGWESIPQSVKDIITQAFDISTTTLPTERLKKKGGMYENKTSDGFDVLEITKGTWTEAIFAKMKPLVEVPTVNILDEGEDYLESDANESDEYQNEPDSKDVKDDDELNEENYGNIIDITDDVDEDEDYDEE